MTSLQNMRIAGLKVLGTTSLERILTFFDRSIEFSDERFYRSNIDDLSYLSTFVDQKLPDMDVMERLTIACAVAEIRNDGLVFPGTWRTDRDGVQIQLRLLSLPG